MDGLPLIEPKFLRFGCTKLSIFVANAKVRLTFNGLVDALARFDFNHCDFGRTSIRQGEFEHPEGVAHGRCGEVARGLPPVVLKVRDTPQVLDPTFVKAKSYQAALRVCEANQQIAERASFDTGTNAFEPLVLVSRS